MTIGGGKCTRLGLPGVVPCAMVLGCLGAVLLCASPTLAQGGDATVASASYAVSVGDVVSVSVLAHPEFSIASARVQSDGTIAYYFGALKVSGLTTESIGKLVADVLVKQKQLAKPVVVVGLISRESKEVNVYGPVRVPGKVVLRDGARVLDVLALSGGLVSDRSEFVRLTVYRADGTSLQVDVSKLFAGDAVQNHVLRPSDNLVFQELDSSQTVVRVVGEVRNPSSIAFPKDGSVVALLNAAGGPTPTAALSKAVILRGGKTISVDLRRYLVDGILPAGAVLEAGDTLVIPVNRNSIRVTGAAGKTGDYPYPDNRELTLADVLGNASLPAQGADLRKVRVIKTDSSGKETVNVVNAEKLLRGESSDQIALQPGDRVHIPSTVPRRPFTLQDITFGVSALVGVARLLGILR